MYLLAQFGFASLDTELLGMCFPIQPFCMSNPDSSPQTALQVRLFDTATLSCTACLVGHTDTVLAIDARPAGGSSGDTLIVSGAKDKSIRLWAAPSGRCLGAYEWILNEDAAFYSDIC